MENDESKKKYENISLTTFAIITKEFNKSEDSPPDKITIEYLLAAAKNNHWEKINKILFESDLEDWNAKDNDSNSLLIYAFLAGQIEIAQTLLSRGAQFTKEEFRSKVQKVLAKKEKVDIAKELLNKFLMVELVSELKKEENEKIFPILNSIVYQTCLAIQNQQVGFLQAIIDNPQSIPEFDFELGVDFIDNKWIIVYAFANSIIEGQYKESKWILESKFLEAADLNRNVLRDQNGLRNYFIPYILKQLKGQKDKLSATECLAIFKELITMKVNPYNDDNDLLKKFDDNLLEKFKEVFPDAKKELEELKTICETFKVDAVKATNEKSSCLVV